MSIQYFTVLGIPKAQGRPRFARVGNFVRAYDPKDSRQYKDNVAAQIVAHNPKLWDDCGILLTIVFHLPRPKGHYRTNGQVRDSAPENHTTKPDLDNLVKAVKDSLKGIVWRDDSQVCWTKSSKEYTSSEPKVEIWVERA